MLYYDRKKQISDAFTPTTWYERNTPFNANYILVIYLNELFCKYLSKKGDDKVYIFIKVFLLSIFMIFPIIFVVGQKGLSRTGIYLERLGITLFFT
jgi:hypothetical protein